MAQSKVMQWVMGDFPMAKSDHLILSRDSAKSNGQFCKKSNGNVAK